MFTRRVEIKQLIALVLLITISSQGTARFIIKPAGYWPIIAYEFKLFIRSKTKFIINKKLERFACLKWYLFAVNYPSKYYALDSVYYGVITLGVAILLNPYRLL